MKTSVQGNYIQMRCIKEQSHYRECSQLETVEHVIKKCFWRPKERDLLRKVSPELDPKFLFDKYFETVVKFVPSFPQLFCWLFAWL